MATSNSDPLSINRRLYEQVGRLLDDLERADRDEVMTMPQRISALIAIGRVQTIFSNLRKSADDGFSGSTVRKYAAAFSKTNAARGGKTNSRSANVVEFDSGGDDDDDDGSAA
jgi:hypothetical protein